MWVVFNQETGESTEDMRFYFYGIAVEFIGEQDNPSAWDLRYED